MPVVGIDLGRVYGEVEGYQPRPFGCKMDTQFHQRHVSRGPPTIPDGRVSRGPVRKPGISSTSLPWTTRGLSADSHTPQQVRFTHGLVPSQPRLAVGSVSDYRAGDETAKFQSPFAPLPVLPARGRRAPSSDGTLLLCLRSYGLMRQSCYLISPSAIASFEMPLPVAISPGC